MHKFKGMDGYHKQSFSEAWTSWDLPYRALSSETDTMVHITSAKEGSNVTVVPNETVAT